MPLFEFQCDKCGWVGESLVFPGEAIETVKCGQCRDGTAHRIFSSFGIKIAGSNPITKRGKSPSSLAAYRAVRDLAPLPGDRGGESKVHDFELDRGKLGK